MRQNGRRSSGNKRESRLIFSFQHIIFILLLPSYFINNNTWIIFPSKGTRHSEEEIKGPGANFN